MKGKLKDYDFTLIFTPIFLAGFGVVMVYSASMVSAVMDGLDSTYFLYKQLQWFVLAMIAFIIACLFPYKYYQKLTKPILAISFLLLLSVMLFGDTVNKATRSIGILGLNLQPSEFVKLAIIIYLASVYSKKQMYIDDFVKGVFPPLIMTSALIVLIVMQPDLGTAAIILLIVATIIISSGLRFKHFLSLSIFGIAALLLLIPKMITETRVARITGAYQPFMDPESSGYHLIQSYVAIGGGSAFGEGLGQSVQKLGYLWGAHTDFIMAIIAEELGVWGIILVIGLFMTITLRGLYFAKKCTDSFGSLLAIGISSMIAIQAIINLGAISGIFPITGVTLPFLSYGGSSLLVVMISMGILNNIAKSVKMQEKEAKKVVNPEETNNFSNRRGSTWPI